MVGADRKSKLTRTTLASAVAHPIRCKCLTVLAERVASPAELARELGIEVSKVGYHVTALAKANLIEEVDQRPVRGAIEHFYRAVELPRVEADDIDNYTPAEHRQSLESVVSIYAADLSNSLDADVLQRRPDHHVTRFAFNLDEQGWEDAAAAHVELEQRIFEIQREATERMSGSDERPLRAVSFQSWFEVPPTQKIRLAAGEGRRADRLPARGPKTPHRGADLADAGSAG